MRTRLVESGAPAAVAFGAIWLVAAAVVEGSTFHLAPLIVAGSAPVTAKKPATGALVGIVIAVGLAVALELVGRLDGPSLLPWGDATLETYLAVLVGAAIGVALAGRRRIGSNPPKAPSTATPDR